jgi:serine/threonine protein kinase
LENLWRQGLRPDVREFLAKQEALTAGQIVAVLLIDQEQRWHLGEQVLAETYLKMSSVLSSAWSDTFELIEAEFRLRRELGENPSIAEFSSRFPQYAAKLQRLDPPLGDPSAVHTANIHTPGGDVMSTAGDVILDPRVAVEWPAIPGYQILGKLGQGGMGHVFKARQDRLGRLAALKIIRKESLSQDPASVRRFQREARAAAQMSHPNIIVIYDFNQIDDTYYLAMEYVEGIDMHNLVQDFGPLRPDVAAEFIRQVAMGLQHAHEQGMVHRDIKPSNLMISLPPSELKKSAQKDQLLFRPDEDQLLKGVVKILDLGTALVSQAIDSTSEQWTKQGALMGTPDYLAPEQAIDSHTVDIRADLYSLGCTLYYLLTGKAPFGEFPLMRKLMMHQNGEARPVRELQPQVPEALEAIVGRLMAKRVQDRFQTPAELADALGKTPAAPASWSGSSPAGDRILDPRTPLPGWTPPPATSSRPPAPERMSSTELPLKPLAGDSSSSDIATPDAQAEEESGLQTPKTIGLLAGHTSMVAALAFSPDRNTLASAAMQGNVRLWDFMGKRPSEKVSFQATVNEIHSIAYSPDKKTLASGSGSLDGTVWLWDLMCPMPRVKATLEGHEAPVEAIAFSPDALMLATGSCDKTILVWDLSSEEPIQHTVFKGHTDTLKTLAFVPDGKTIVSSGMDGTVRLWRKGSFWSKPQLAVLEGSWGAVHCLAVSPDAAILAFGGLEETVRLWSLTGEQPREVAILKGHSGVIRRLLFPPDGKTMVSVCEGGRIILWDLATLSQAREWQMPQENRSSIALTHDGRYVAAGLTDGTVHVFRLYPKRRRSHH